MKNMHMDTSDLRRMILDNPDLPLLVFVSSELCEEPGYYYVTANTFCYVGEYLSADGPDSEKIYTERDEVEEDLEEALFEDGVTDEDLAKQVAIRMAEYEPHWVKCIIVECRN